MATAFDLEKAIAAWRRPLEHHRTFSGEDLEELENSLRDRIEALVEAGMSEEGAFRKAVGRMGSYATAETEYRKVYWGKLKRRRQLLPELVWRLSMLKNYLKIALRNLLRQKGYSFINIAGLTLGLTCCLLIFQYVAFEYSFDDFNENADHLYRVVTTEVKPGREPATWAQTGYAMGPDLAQQVPEVVRYARVHPEYSPAVVFSPTHPDNVFEERWVYYADPAFFEMFTYPLVEGEPGQVLSEPGTILLSESAARKYFGAGDPMGQVLDVTGRISGSFRVAGVFEDPPAHSHLQFDLLLPMRDVLQTEQYQEDDGWDASNFNTYVQLREGVDLAAIERKFTDVLMRSPEGRYNQEDHTTETVHIQPLRDIHLGGIFAAKVIAGSHRAVRFFTIIGLVTLLIALINYVNLATARAMGRAREVGVRKVVGARRRQLVTQFLFESALTNVVAVALAVALALLLRPLVNQLAGTTMTLAVWTSPVFWAAFLTAFCAATLIAGLYPAFVLSSFRPVVVLKGKAGSLASQAWLRRGLVVVQFAASIALLVGTAIVHQQFSFMQNLDLGIDLEQILTVPGPRVLPEGTDRATATETFLQELRQIPSVRQVASSSTLPGQGFSSYMGDVQRAAADPTTAIPGVATRIDTSFARVYGLELVAGEGFKDVSNPPSSGEPRLLIANETAVRAVGFDTPEEALNQVVSVLGGGRIVGVFKDFHWSSMHQRPENIFFYLDRGNRQVSLKVSTQNLPQTIAAVEELYKRRFPGNPFRYSFADEQFAQQYKSDERLAALFSLFAGMAVGIACLGLFGLASFTAQRRTKEIGVRKVLGASVHGIVALLSKEFLKLVGVAFGVGALVAYFALERWLADYPYRIDLGPGVFLTAGAAVLVIALVTVSYQSIRAALADPVKSLRYE